MRRRQQPEVQKKAHDEITQVIGHDKIPEFSDRDSLPYVQAVYLEVLRWMPAVPVSIPHGTVGDDIFGGYFIPKGTIVVANIWRMLNSPEKYPDPRAFRPERFLTAEGKLTENTGINSILTFGFGRRVCAGRHFADALVWRVIASVLATFTVEKVKDDPVDRLNNLEDAFADGSVSHVIPFKCSIIPRTPTMADLIRSMEL